MRLLTGTLILLATFCLQGCITLGPNPEDPYESINREIFKFNLAFDATVLKPPAKLYAAVLPAPVRAGVNNFYTNINMIPTVINDILQADFPHALKDTWRFIANTSFGIGGIFDPASVFGLPPRSNDLGLTFAHWGDKKSPYVMIPFLGPSTLRDGMALMFEYTFFTPYPYLRNEPLLYSLLAIRYVDLRSQMLSNDKLLGEALDKYMLVRSAYLQHRHYLMTGENVTQDDGSLYVDEADSSEPNALPPPDPKSAFPLTTS
ncbi:MAG: VacJ family lipoprotein [Gammaproteobacteria bacterium]|nr:VacJ family lipoprotein [Gammaproteobacteria bacterium]